MSSTPRNAQRGFGLAVRHFRLAKGLTQEDLAELTDLHATAISKIESGGRDPRLATTVRIANGLEIPRWQLHLTGELFEWQLSDSDDEDRD